MAPLLCLNVGRLLVESATAVARLNQRLHAHHLSPAFLFRARLDAIQCQAAVDGQLVDPFRLVAVLEGLPLRDSVAQFQRLGVLQSLRGFLTRQGA